MKRQSRVYENDYRDVRRKFAIGRNDSVGLAAQDLKFRDPTESLDGTAGPSVTSTNAEQPLSEAITCANGPCTAMSNRWSDVA